ncbi:MAG: hypothetical protein ACR2OJ_13380 [Hyphomicrobiales bacterium]
MFANLRTINTTCFLSSFGRLLYFTRFLVAVGLTLILVVSFQDAKAAQLKEERAEGILAFLALSFFAKTAANSANAKRETDKYDYNEDLGARENAVASCLHRAYRNALQRGGRSLRLDEVRKLDEKNNEEFEITIRVTEFFSSGEERTTILRCLVNKDKVIDITS